MFQPTGNLIVVKRKERQEEKVTSSGLIIEQEKKIEQTNTSEGKVISFGENVSKKIKKDMTIYYQTHAEQEINIDGEKIQIIQEPSIIGYEI